MLKKKKIVYFYFYKLGFVLYMKREFISHTKKEEMNKRGKRQNCSHYGSLRRRDNIASGHISREIILVQPGNRRFVTILLWGNGEWRRFKSVLGQDTESKDRQPLLRERRQGRFPGLHLQAVPLETLLPLPSLAVAQKAGAEASDLMRAVCRLPRQTLRQ